jgi:hypothetical protein
LYLDCLHCRAPKEISCFNHVPSTPSTNSGQAGSGLNHGFWQKSGGKSNRFRGRRRNVTARAPLQTPPCRTSAKPAGEVRPHGQRERVSLAEAPRRGEEIAAISHRHTQTHSDGKSVSRSLRPIGPKARREGVETQREHVYSGKERGTRLPGFGLSLVRTLGPESPEIHESRLRHRSAWDEGSI